MNGGLCTDDGLGSYNCNCRDNYIGANCTIVNHCMINPCQNGGTCTSDGLLFTCSCPAGYSGTTCSEGLSGVYSQH